MRLRIKHWTSRLVLTVAAAATFASCNKDDVTTGEPLPDGKYPLTFTASVEGLTAVKATTRATVDNTWTGGEVVAVQVAGTPSATVKKYTAAIGGALTAHADNAPFYWQTTVEQKTVSAWYPYSAARPESFSVRADQSGAGFQQSDLIYAAPAAIVYSGNKELTFKHLPAKVVVNLKNGDGVSEAEVKNATVTLINQSLTSGTISYDGSGVASVAQATTGSAVITANVVTSPIPADYQKSVQALTTPQQMKDKQFVKVTIGQGNYYYTPKIEADGNLEAGKQYTYNITVSRSGLSAKVEVSDWDNTPGTVYPDAGMGDDGVRKPLDQAVVGDFYCKDEFGAYLISKDVNKDFFTKAQKDACLGVVFWVGDPTNDDPLLEKEHPGCTHGLIVALHEVGGKTMKWNTSGYESVTDNWLSKLSNNPYIITSLKTEDKMQGYANTKALNAYNTSSSNVSNNPALKMLPVVAIEEYNTDHPVPTGNSGWYVPSIMELQQVCWGQGASGQSTNGRDMLNTQFDKVGGTKFSGTSSWFYWSSSEGAGGSSIAWGVHFDDGSVNYYDKSHNEFWVRALSAF